MRWSWLLFDKGLAGDFLEFMRHDTRMLAQPAVPTGSLLAPARHCLTAVDVDYADACRLPQAHASPEFIDIPLSPARILALKM